jgi:dinuclear metal center YbgI/SA1388 family protein
MISCSNLVKHCNELLNVTQFKDYCPNGLQIEGSGSIANLISGVSANQALIDAAIEQHADALLVHHGFFWKGENPVISGIKKQRIQALLVNNINLIAYHLPLDAHKTLGNNILLAEQLGLNEIDYFSANEIAIIGSVASQTGVEFKQRLTTTLSREPLHVPVERPIHRVALCTGAAQNYIEQAIEQGADAFVSGEISENTWHIAKENNVHYFAAGHHATERYGVQALGDYLAQKFTIKHQFIDIINPV